MSDEENSKVEIEAIKSSPGVKEITIRRGEALKLEPEPKPIPLKEGGLLINPYQYLKARGHLCEPDDCHLRVDKNEGSLVFTSNDKIVNKDVITGKLTFSKALTSFGINESKYWGDKELAKFFRRNSFYFSDPSIHTNIVSQLMRLDAKIKTTIEKNADLKGNVKHAFEMSVDSNIPDSFFINIPIYEGYEKVSFEVFIGAEANSSEVKFYLESAILYELIEKEKEAILSENIKHFEDFGCVIFYV